jgi:rhodanese-related sulfurtransferase
MTFASSPLPVFIKKVFSVPSWPFDTIFEVDAELQPPPPAEETLVVVVSRPRSSITAGSSLILHGIVYLLNNLSIRVVSMVEIQ